MAKQQELLVAELGAVDNTQAAFNSVQRSIDRTAKKSKDLNGQLRIVRGGFGQLGHQIQDIAVQLQMGTNAMIVFGQQGSQIASLMGPKGALVGALFAVGAAIGVSLTNGIKESRNALVDLNKEIMDLAQKGREVTPAMMALNAALKEQKVLDLAKKYSDDQEALDDLSRKVRLAEENLRLLNQNIGIDKETDKTYLAAVQRLRELSNEEKVLAARMGVTQEQLTMLAEGHTVSADLRIAANKRLFESAHAELDLMVKTKEEKDKEAKEEEKRQDLVMQARLAALKNFEHANNAELNELKRLHDAKQKAHEEDQEREKLAQEARMAATDNVIANANRELDEIKRIEQEKQRAKEQTLQFTQNTLGSLASMMEEGSKEQKALLVAEQGMRVVSATMAAFDAANKAMAASGGNPVVGNLVLALGLANAAAIAGQAIASFEGGGMIPDGPRAGGVDGRGGRMAIVHPNEKITDMRRGGGDNKPVNISFNIQANDAQGFDELLVKRRALIVNMVNKAVNNSGRRSLT